MRPGSTKGVLYHPTQGVLTARVRLTWVGTRRQRWAMGDRACAAVWRVRHEFGPADGPTSGARSDPRGFRRGACVRRGRRVPPRAHPRATRDDGAFSGARALGRGLVAVGAEPVGLEGAVEADAVRVVGRVAL
eukprot:5637302-Prymnesium_polylepis.1